MHQHICTHNCHSFFFEDSFYFGTVSEYDFNLLTVFLCCLTDLAAGIAIYSCAGFICHAYCCKVRLFECRIYFQRFQFKTSFFIHLTDCTFMEIFARLNQTCRKFINVIAQCVAILAYQNNLVLLLSIDTINDHTIRIITSGLQFQRRNILGSGCHVIRHRGIVNTCSIHMIQIDKTVICHFFYIMNLSHGFPLFCTLCLLCLNQSPLRITRILL